MPNIGNRTVNLHTVDKSETVYAGATNSVSHTDTVALARRERKARSQDPLRTAVRFERGFAVGDPELGQEKNVTVSIAVTVPPGVNPTLVDTYVADSLTQAAVVAGKLAVSGDIHLEA